VDYPRERASVAHDLSLPIQIDSCFSDKSHRRTCLRYSTKSTVGTIFQIGTLIRRNWNNLYKKKDTSKD
jgi:hypothetical protein